jgi:hypothetical protein
VDDLNPTLFETVAAFLPAGSILEDCVLQCDSEGLSIEAIWPAWNPWLSQAADVNSTETLRGSAMAFLGLSSAPGSTTGGYFGDNVLGTTQIHHRIRMWRRTLLLVKLLLWRFLSLGIEI